MAAIVARSDRPLKARKSTLLKAHNRKGSSLFSPHITQKPSPAVLGFFFFGLRVNPESSRGPSGAPQNVPGGAESGVRGAEPDM